MASLNWALVIIEFSILTYLAGLSITHGDSVCGNQGNYTQDSAYAKSVNETLFALPEASKGNGFYSASSRSTEDNQTTAYAFALCPGEFENERCLECVRSINDRIRRACPNQIKATGCTASTGGYIQATMQCIPNLSQTKCNECFDNATNYLQISYDGSNDGVVYSRYSCLLRYTISLVDIGNPSTQMPPTNSPSVPNPGKERSKVIIPAVVAAAVTVAILSFFIFLKIRRICTKKGEEELFEASDDETGEIIYFRLKEIQAATRYFSAANKLGEGGFGPVYWASMLWHEDNGVKLIDENLCDDCPVDEALKLMRIALLCIEEDPVDRPTMSSVASMLEGEWKSLSEPKPPMSFGQFATSDKSSSTWNSDDSGFYSTNGSIVHTGKSLEIQGIGHRGL
ncbi:hypothetical protein L2E82_31296 [Cichorium intybus]|uniref:Uncharacterized protein n=1 Tax=Cichorium intybus TaxID=13427 RepID=A0ACB9D2M3_CICIN|nr:hypothetical protein L2E82_31296 [Cichorium intybus]